MIIGSRVSLQEDQLYDRKEKGIKYIELEVQLNDVQDVQEALNKKNKLKELGLCIYAVCPPSTNSKNGECVLGEPHASLRKENLNIMKKTIILAHKLSDVGNPIVKIPIGGLMKKEEITPLNIKMKKEMIQKDLMELRNYVFQHYPNVTLVIENNPKYWKIEKGEFEYVVGFEDDIVKWVRSLRDTHIGLSLNVSYALGMIRYNKMHYPNAYYSSIFDYIQSYAPYLKLIHLSNGMNFVSDKEEYGLPYVSENKEDISFLQEFFKAIHLIKYHHPITIDTREKDDNNAQNFIQTKSSIVECFKKN